MICPNCGNQNAETSRFCMICGHKLPDRPALGVPQPLPLPPVPQRVPKDPVAQIALICGIAGIAGGGLTVLGWLIPWFSLGGLLDSALRLIGIGSGSGLLKFGSGVGSGLQVSLFLLLGSFAAFSDADTILLGLLGLVLLGVFVSIPILGVQNVRSGIRAIEIRLASTNKPVDRYVLTDHMDDMRGRSKAIFVIMVIIFVVMTVIPLGTSVLGGGFYLTAIGAICSYLGAFFGHSRLLSLPK